MGIIELLPSWEDRALTIPSSFSDFLLKISTLPVMFTFPYYAINTCYVAFVRYYEPRLCPMVNNKGSSEQPTCVDRYEETVWAVERVGEASDGLPAWKPSCLLCEGCQKPLEMLMQGSAGPLGSLQLLEQLCVPIGLMWEMILLGLHHSLTMLSGPTFKLCM